MWIRQMCQTIKFPLEPKSGRERERKVTLQTVIRRMSCPLTTWQAGIMTRHWYQNWKGFNTSVYHTKVFFYFTSCVCFHFRCIWDSDFHKIWLYSFFLVILLIINFIDNINYLLQVRTHARGYNTFSFTRENVSNTMFCFPKKGHNEDPHPGTPKDTQSQESSIEVRPTWLPKKQKNEIVFMIPARGCLCSSGKGERDRRLMKELRESPITHREMCVCVSFLCVLERVCLSVCVCVNICICLYVSGNVYVCLFMYVRCRLPACACTAPFSPSFSLLPFPFTVRPLPHLTERHERKKIH